jgi:7-cyano-7-deazaguanine synthase in queuosine biosynthesis
MNDRFQDETALVLFSGGQDSATCLAWALQRFARVEMLGFNYGQRHAIELGRRGQLLDGMKSLRADTCYLGERGARHDWGYGCGECPACQLRAKGWLEYAARAT